MTNEIADASASSKKPLRILSEAGRHWVGNGFPVKTIVKPSYGEVVSPFVLLDYAGPAEFQPGGDDEKRGVGEHPHRGFETVTIVFQGELEHNDSAGNSGRIGPGDVQWMTAGSGVVHEEWHGSAFTKQGGVFEVIQLWVNLPARDKMKPPKYQELLSTAIPVVELPGNAGRVRVLAGEYAGAKGPAETFTPMKMLDIQLPAGKAIDIPSPPGETALLLVRRGRIKGSERSARKEVTAEELVVFEPSESDSPAPGQEPPSTVRVHALEDSELVFLGGDPIKEPVVAHGPFVMNTQDEIRQALDDYRAGRLGR